MNKKHNEYRDNPYWTDDNLVHAVQTAWYSPTHAYPDLDIMEAELERRGIDPYNYNTYNSPEDEAKYQRELDKFIDDLLTKPLQEVIDENREKYG